MAIVAGRRPHPLVRPMLGTGVLGGYTTFSTYAVEVRALAGRSVPLAGAYAVATLVGALAATALAYSLTSRALR
jgi:CrcB protein